MAHLVEFSGKDLEEAIASAAAALNLPPEKVRFSVLTMGSKGFWGLGRRRARISVDPADPALNLEEEDQAEAPKNNTPRPGAGTGPEGKAAAGPSARPDKIPKSREDAPGPPDEAGSRDRKAKKPPRRRESRPETGPEEKAAGTPMPVKALEWSHVPPPPTEPGPGEAASAALPDDPEGRLAEELLLEITGRMGLEVRISRRRLGSRIVLDLDSPDQALLTGNRGAALEALQFLAAKILARRRPDESGQDSRLVLDVAGYRARRQAQVLENLKNAAEQARSSLRPQTLGGLNPAERRLALLALRPFKDLAVQNSAGRDALVVIPASAQRPPRPRGPKGPRPAEKQREPGQKPAARRSRRPRPGGDGRKQSS